MTMLCMSWDHRAIDGAYAARFLTTLRRRIEAV
jgi:2-oxoglutarate dehydrogenase E2 component (dihydrolipoamide succinyltransferase)